MYALDKKGSRKEHSLTLSLIEAYMIIIDQFTTRA